MHYTYVGLLGMGMTCLIHETIVYHVMRVKYLSNRGVAYWPYANVIKILENNVSYFVVLSSFPVFVEPVMISLCNYVYRSGRLNVPKIGKTIGSSRF